MHVRSPLRNTTQRSVLMVCVCAWLLAIVAACGNQSSTSPSGEPPPEDRGPTTFYLATNGNDQGAGSASAPWRTLRYATSRLRAGDTLLLRGGNYDDWFDNPNLQGRSWSESIRIAAQPGETVWLAPSSGMYVVSFQANQQYVELDGINLDARRNRLGAPVKIEGWSGGNAHHIRIKNAEIISGSDGVPNQGTNGGGTAILATAAVGGIVGGNEFLNLRIHGGGDPGDFSYGFYIQSNDNLIEQCDISDTSGAGIQIYNGYGYPPTNNIVRGNQIHDIRRSADNRIWGILDAGDGSQIRNNTIVRVGVPGGSGAGVDLYYGHNPIVDGNTIFENHPRGIYIESGVRNATVTNNILHSNGADLVDLGIETQSFGNSLSRR